MRTVTVVCILLLMSCSEPQPVTSLFGADGSKQASTPVSKDKPITLPDDHQSHPQFDIEWWYLTFVLEDSRQRPYGLQFTLFRFSSDRRYPSNWSDSQLWMGHASLHTLNHHFFEERLGAGGVGNVFVSESLSSSRPFSAQMDNWRWQSESSSLTPSILSFTINDGVSVSLQLHASGPLIKHGDNGYSMKTADEQYRSYYYSQPFIEANGELQVGDETFKVTGSGWFDHEWTSELANKDALGWDWFSLHLNNGDKVMAFRMHVNDRSPFVTGTYVTAAGRQQTLSDDAILLTPTGTESIGDHQYPVNWRMRIPDKSLDISLAPFKPGQRNNGRFPYYEGRIEISGTHTGSGFLELTGY